MNAKLLLQILLTLGCVALLIGVSEAVFSYRLLLTAQGWWRVAIALWVLLVAVRATYPAKS